MPPTRRGHLGRFEGTAPEDMERKNILGKGRISEKTEVGEEWKMRAGEAGVCCGEEREGGEEDGGRKGESEKKGFCFYLEQDGSVWGAVLSVWK